MVYILHEVLLLLGNLKSVVCNHQNVLNHCAEVVVVLVEVLYGQFFREFAKQGPVLANHPSTLYHLSVCHFAFNDDFDGISVNREVKLEK